MIFDCMMRVLYLCPLIRLFLLLLLYRSTYNVTYISRTTDHSTRSLYMQYFGVAVSIGYGIGPLLASGLTRICSSAALAGLVYGYFVWN